MKNKIIALTLALIILLIALTSCMTQSTYDNSSGDEFDKFAGYLFYNNFFYYKGKVEPESNDYTLTVKYHNLDNMQKYGLPLYSDFLGTEDDPFKDATGQQFALDKKATAENNNIPVILIVQRYGKDPETEDFLYEILSFNTATNKITVIADEIPDISGTVYLKDDYIYFHRFIGKKPSEDGYDENAENGLFLFKMSKLDGKTQRFDVDRDHSIFLYSEYNGQIYFRKADCLYRSDSNFDNIELLLKFPSQLRVWKGYAYYAIWDTKDINGNEYTYCNYYRRPLEDIFNDSKEELVLENVFVTIRYYNDTLYYYQEEDLAFAKENRYEETLIKYFKKCYFYNTETGQTGVLYDFSNTERKKITLDYFSDNYYIITYAIELDDPNDLLGYDYKKILVSRKTGQEITIDSIYD